MIYELFFDMERIDKAIVEGTNTIFAKDSNMYKFSDFGVKEGFFDNIIYKNIVIDEKKWPCVKFYYSSIASNLESEYLLNSSSWPIIHKKVMEEFELNGISGIQYLPIELIDVVTNHINKNYVVMNLLHYIEGIDINKSKYVYNDEFDCYTFLPNATYMDKKICEPFDIFRCTKSVPAIYVSEKIVNIIEKQNWVGFYFRKQKIA